MFQFSCRSAFLSTFRLSNWTPKITWILTLCLPNTPTLTLFSKEDKILIKNLYECKGYNARQFITEFLNNGWTKNSINRLLVKFRTVDRRLRSGRRCAHTDENVDTVESLLLNEKDKTQISEPPNSQRNFTWGGDPSIISFVDYSQRTESQVLQEKARSTAEWSAQHARVIFGMQFERR